jgi:hypothetical protein
LLPDAVSPVAVVFKILIAVRTSPLDTVSVVISPSTSLSDAAAVDVLGLRFLRRRAAIHLCWLPSAAGASSAISAVGASSAELLQQQLLASSL